MRHPAWRNLKEKAIATAVICVVYLVAKWLGFVG